MQNTPEESDWKHFRKIVPELRERYLRERNAEMIAIFHDESLSPTERFWEASARMNEIGRILVDCFDDHKRSKMVSCIMLMHRHQILVDADMAGFSDELQKCVAGQM